MKLTLFLLLLIPLMLTPAFSQSLITFDVDTTKFTPGEIVELQGIVQSGLEGQPVAVEIKDADGNLILIRTVTSDSNGEFTLKFKVPNSATSGEFDIVTNLEIDGDAFSEITSADESGVTENVTVSTISNKTPVAYTKPNCGTGTIEKNGVCVVDTTTQIEEKSSKGGGCLIATATYGSELATEVQQLRELRDNKLLNTESGTVFIATFNDIYYSFSPIIADYERENPYFKDAVKIAITPLISTLSLMENAESESEVLQIGLSVIALNLGMYLGVPAVMIVGIRRII
jgi:hypothetical protein